MRMFEAFEAALQNALLHLHDPTYRPEMELRRTLGELPWRDKMSVIIIDTIESLKPEAEAPPTARTRRMYDLLTYRFVQEVTQKETARRLGISPRHLRREQQQAIRLLAEKLWPHGMEAGSARGLGTAFEGDATVWRDQLQMELSSLERQTPSPVANVARVILDAVELERGLGARHGVELGVLPVSEDLTALIHPTVLSQLLITAIEKLAGVIPRGEIVLSAERWMRWTRIVVRGGPVAQGGEVPVSDFIQETLSTHGGLVTTRRVDDVLEYEFQLQSDNGIAVLVVDDNLDLVHFYRRYTEGTRYRIIHVEEGRRVFEAIRQADPDIVVLDVMLPDVNGWQLLRELRQRAETQHLPVVVASVVRQEALAHALGAVGCLIKPIQRLDFIEALDQAQNRA